MIKRLDKWEPRRDRAGGPVTVKIALRNRRQIDGLGGLGRPAIDGRKSLDKACHFPKGVVPAGENSIS